MSTPRDGMPRRESAPLGSTPRRGGLTGADPRGPEVTRRRGATRRTFLALAGTALVGTTVACSASGRPGATRGPSSSAAAQQQVWAHMVPQGLPLAESGDIHYGSERPLALAPAGTDYASLVSGQLEQGRAAGLTGMQILLLEGENKGSDFLGDWMDAADPTWQDGAEGFAVAPCLLVSSRDGAVQMIRQYAEVADGRSSAARVEDALVVWIYNARSLSPEDWASCRGAVEESGTRLHLVAELATAASQHGDSLDTSLLDPYADTFEAVWLFEDRESQVLGDFAAWAAAHGTVFAGGTLPGYDRETSHGGYVDARGTQLWRTQLERARDSGAAWLTAVTWNDAVEHTSVQPTTDWGTTRADLLAHHAAAFRGHEPQEKNLTAYVTSPQYLVAGQELLVEGLAINHESQDARVTVRVTDADGTTLATSQEVTVAAGEVGAAVLERTVRVSGGAHVFAVVELRDASGELRSSTRGAPVVVFAAGDPAIPDPPRRRWYSLSSAATVDFSRWAKIEGEDDDAASPSDLRVLTERTVRSVEFLHNTWPAGLALAARELSYRAPPDSLVGGQEVTTVTQGFTVARLVTEAGEIAYSAPVHHGTVAGSGDGDDGDGDGDDAG